MTGFRNPSSNASYSRYSQWYQISEDFLCWSFIEIDDTKDYLKLGLENGTVRGMMGS